jgi:ribonucleoside-diphosphate reductase alpha chain
MNDFRFLKEGEAPYDATTRKYRDCKIENSKGETIFELKGVEAPVFWSDTAVNICASKYFNIEEKSVYDMVDRVANRIADWGNEQGYFSSHKEELSFCYELKYILINQYAIFNSPVWFNLGNPGKQTIAACFILDVEDDMKSITEWYGTESLIFKEGSGAGVNLSKLRASIEPLSGGGVASGPLSFMKVSDTLAGVIKAGGTVRRAAKLIVLDIDHLDIENFIESKMLEEIKAKDLIAHGYSGDRETGAYSAVFYQNTNHSVRLTDAFMEAVNSDDWWMLKSRKTSPKFMDTEVKARDLFKKIARAVWECGDPGLQFHDSVNKWNTCKNDGEITATNPCGELAWLSNTACNLASINLIKFYDFKELKFNIEAFRHVVDVMITAQDIMVAKGDYPTNKIKENSIKYRPLGLGYANLGGLLMRMGYPYDSDVGRDIASIITAMMTGQAYLTSNKLAERLGSFDAFKDNKDEMCKVIVEHKRELSDKEFEDYELIYWREAIRVTQNIWKELASSIARFRNSQVTLLAPTGTTGLVMDCDTMGIEPEFSLIKYKTLAGGGTIKTISKCAEDAIKAMYDEPHCEQIIKCLREYGFLDDYDKKIMGETTVFDTAISAKEGGSCISPQGHLRMVAAVQPFLSGAISKTINMPNNCTIEDVEEIYMEAWIKGLKGVTVYRDGSKGFQPLTTSLKEEEVECVPVRKKLPKECQTIRHKFRVGETEGYIHAGLYDSGELGEVFVTLSKEGSTLAGLLDSLAILTSMSLQHGVSLESLVDKFSHTRFEPAGFTNNDDIPMASSLVDYIFRYLGSRFLTKEEQATIGLKTNGDSVPYPPKEGTLTGVICSLCGNIMIRSGSCYSCQSCGSTTGCS